MMKKIILLIAILFLISLAPNNLMAAGSSFTVSADSIEYSTGVIVVKCLFTADDTNGSIPTLTFTGSTWTDGTNSGVLPVNLYGKVLTNVYIDCNHAGTEPTENSDMEITSGGISILNGAGTDMIDNTSERNISPQDSQGVINYMPIIGSTVITITQASVATNSATGAIYLILISRKA